MITRHTCAALALALLGLAGCAQPAPSAHGLVLSGHAPPLVVWDNSADRVASDMRALGVFATPAHPAMPGQMPYPGPYYLYVQRPNSVFLEQVRSTLETELLGSGADVVRSPVGATVINLNSELVGNTVKWHAVIVTHNRLLMKLGDQFNISDNDAALYYGASALAPLSSPGLSMFTAAVPLRYAR